MFGKRQPPPGRRGGLISARPSTRLLQSTKPSSALKPRRESTDVTTQLAPAGVTVGKRPNDQNAEQTPDVSIRARTRASPKRALRQGGNSMGSDDGALRDTSNNGRLAKDLMGSQHAAKHSSGNAGRLCSNIELPALSTHRSEDKGAVGHTHGSEYNKPKVQSRYPGSGPSQEKRLVAGEDRLKSINARGNGYAASAQRPGFTTNAVAAVETASADVALREMAEQQRERGDFKAGSAQDFYSAAGRATSAANDGRQGDANIATWQPSSSVAATALPLRDVEDGAEASGPPHTPDSIVERDYSCLPKTAAEALSTKPKSSSGKQREPTSLPGGTDSGRQRAESGRGEQAEVGYEASMGRLLELRREVRELARPQPWCPAASSAQADARGLTSIHSPAGQHTRQVPAGRSERSSGGGGEDVRRVLSPPHMMGVADCLPPSGCGVANHLAASEPGTEEDADSSCGSTLVVRSASPFLAQGTTGGAKGAAPEGSNNSASDARMRRVCEEAEQLQQVLGNLKLAEEGLREDTWQQRRGEGGVEETRSLPKVVGGLDPEASPALRTAEEGRVGMDQAENKVGEGDEKAAPLLEGGSGQDDSGGVLSVGGVIGRRRGSIERKGSITWYHSTAFKEGKGNSEETSGMGVLAEKGEGEGKVGGGREVDKDGGEQLIEKRMVQIEEEAKRRRDEEWKVELAKLVAEDQELKKLNAKLEAEKRRLEEAVGLSGVGAVGPPGRKWEVLRVRLYEVEQELSALKVHAAGLGAEGEAMRRKLEGAEAAVRSGEQGTQTRLAWYENRLRAAFEETEAHHAAYRSVEDKYREAADSCRMLEQRVEEHQERCSQWWGEREKAIREREEEGGKRGEAEKKLREVEESAEKKEEEGVERVRVAEEEVAKLLVEVDLLKRQLADSQAQEAQLRADLEESRAGVQRAFLELESTGKELGEMGALRKRVSDAGREREQCECALEQAQGEVRTLKGENERKGGEVRGQKEMVEEVRRRMEEGERRMEELERAVRVGQGQVEVRDMEVEELREKLVIETGWKERAEREVKEVRAMEGEASEEWRKWKGQAGVLEREVGEAGREILELELRMAKREGETGGMREVAREKEKSCEEAGARLKGKEVELGAANAEVVRLSIEIGTLQNAMERVMVEGRRWEESKGKVVEEREAMEGRIAMLEKKLRDTEREKGGEVVRWREEAGRERMERERMGKRVEGMEREAGVVEAKMREVEDLNLELEQQWLEAGGEIQILREYLKDKGVVLD